MSNWIKFTDRLPEENQLILFRDDSTEEGSPGYFRDWVSEWKKEWQPLYTQNEKNISYEDGYVRGYDKGHREGEAYGIWDTERKLTKNGD